LPHWLLLVYFVPQIFKQMKLYTENIEKKYGKRTVVKGVSINVNQGEIVGLLGPNGAGQNNLILYDCRLNKTQRW
jgi:ABC-type lipopolysaccharide export system ATPase subunit